ncbi:beta-ketoacyl-ACP reductase [Sphingobium lactosutens]|mgnify:CR=1 FL=1|uniref:SDR family oxidoreductase n=1 Tax=Sphingobium lactosutens TaxID=522773 RepID=UPI0015BE966B|nr:SDR family NAD(P)-dependent oxidoreductase [Sphingobium lactosutens]NWK95963.1 beta-ketoacyl-ACP reductase [Sphingobium lactosutens]
MADDIQKAPQRLDGMTAIVTGGAKGIGLAVAQGLAARGCRLALWDIDDAALQAASDDLTALGADVSIKKVNIVSEPEVQAAVAELLDRNGRIDVLVNNAGIGGDKLLVKMELDFWQRVIDTNLTSQFICCKAVAPTMVEQRFGRIINISSRAWLGNRGQASYSASKGGIVSLTRTLALEFAREGLTVNAVAPGIIETPLFATLKPEVQDRLMRSVPMERIGQAEDIANAVCFFALPASSYVTGQLLYVCGGRSLGSPSV